jgi:hypothetical protein
MNVLVLESNENEQKEISKLLHGSAGHVRYETSIPSAINSLGIEHTDIALVDADCKGSFCSWKDMVKFCKKFKIDYAVFSSNGKVGMRDGQRIVSIKDIPAVINGMMNCASQV